MGVAVGLVGVDRGHLDRGLDPGVGQGLADVERGVETVETAAHVGQTDVADLKCTPECRASSGHVPEARGRSVAVVVAGSVPMDR
jgi:hypothetical protein